MMTSHRLGHAYLWYSLQKQEEHHGNINLHGIKIIKIGSQSPALFKKKQVQSEYKWTLVPLSSIDIKTKTHRTLKN